MVNVRLFSSSLPRFDKSHEMLRIFTRTEQTFVTASSSIHYYASFWSKNDPYGFERAPSPAQKSLSISKWLFFIENECDKRHQNFRPSIIFQVSGEYLWLPVAFVEELMKSKCTNGKLFSFSQAHSNALTNTTRRHEYFRGLSRHLPVPGVIVSFLELRFLRKISLLTLGERPFPLKKPSQSQKGHFYKKMNVVNDTKTQEMAKSAKEKGEYLWSSAAFVEAWKKRKFPHGTTGLKNHAKVA